MTDNDNEPLRSWDIRISTIVTVKLPAGVVPPSGDHCGDSDEVRQLICEAVADAANEGSFNIDGTEDMTDEV